MTDQAPPPHLPVSEWPDAIWTPEAEPDMWSPTIPNFPLFWDSTMLGLLKECPKKFHYQIILGFQPKGLNVHLYFGQLFHAGLERYEHARAAGQDHDAATLAMVKWTMEASGLRDEDGTWTPWESGDPIKNRYTLVRSLVWRVEDRLASPLATVILANGKPAVELSFRFHAFDLGSEPITFCGHLDRLVHFEAANWVEDHKTTKGALDARFFASFTPHNQFSLYTIAGRVVLGDKCQGVMVAGVQVGVGFTRSAVRSVPRPAPVLDEWLADAQWWITQARSMALANHWPMNDKSCGNYFGCAFAKVCGVSPHHRPSWLKMDFDPWTWNPLILRGDV